MRWLVDGMIGFSLFLSTVHFGSNRIIAVTVLLVFLTAGARFHGPAVLPSLFAVGALVNALVHLGSFDVGAHATSVAVVLIPVMVLIAPRVSDRAWSVFVALVCVEVAIAGAQFLGVGAALSLAADSMAEAGGSGQLLLYARRVGGLSPNSSDLAVKVFVSIVLLTFMAWPRRCRRLAGAALGAGLLVTFNRTAIAATLVLLAILGVRWAGPSLKRMAVVLSFALISAGGILTQFDAIRFQFMRGTEVREGDLNRVYYLQQVGRHLSVHPLAGNGSLTYRVRDLNGLEQHAHNSIAMLLGTHGMVLGSLLLAYLLLSLNRSNWWGIAVLLTFGITQYVVFWNASAADMALYWIAGRRPRTPPDR